FGGGMGNTQVTTGATVYLPVFHEGGLLTIGDCHAAMGDGEATASAVECALDATLRITIEPHLTVSRPLVTTATEVMTTGEGETGRHATKGLWGGWADWRRARGGMEHPHPAMLFPRGGAGRPGSAGPPPYTIRVAVPTSVLTL